ncbi:MAG: Dabb family protein [Syntrophobacteraceae bacterium]|jgi:uncharacterized UPF0160 family protein
MIKHVVFMKFKKDTHPEDIESMEKGLDSLPGIIPEIKYYDFGRDVLHSERSYDFALVSAFDNLESMQRYINHPQHQTVAKKCRELSDSIVVVDFESGVG